MPDPVSQGASSSSTPQFRTYASDVAALTGKPLPKNVKNEPAPLPEPPPARIIPNAPSTSESREDVLARLKGQAGGALPPLPKKDPDLERQAVIERLKTKAPSFVPPQRIQESSPLPPGIPAVEKPVAPSPIHTYKSDFSEHATASGTSRIGMIAAQQDVSAPPPVVLPAKKKSGALLFVAGAIFVLAGLGSVYAAYRFATGEPPIPEETFIPTLIFADERIHIGGSAEELRDALANTTGEALGERDVAIVYMTYATTTEAGIVEEVASGGELFAALRLSAPSILLRNVETPSTVGVIRAGGETRPFFILRVSSYDRTFAGMLEWEPTMERDLSLFYPPHPVSDVTPVATTTASTTPPVAPPAFRLSFVDEVIGNRDVRVLRDGDNRIVLLYGYQDKTTLVIARSEAAFLELLERLSSTRSR